ncbi:adenylate/guanylate cyclase domain-containing protein [Desulforhopalus sp. 52FAK]
MSSILLIDGSNQITTGCVKALKPLGHEVICADVPVNLAALPLSQTINLVIINSSSDGSVDIELFKSLRIHNPVLQGILLVDDGDFERVVMATNCGINKVCIKPVSMTELKKAVVDLFKTVTSREEITRMKAFLPLYKLGQKLLLVSSEDEIFDELAEIIRNEFGSSTVSIMMLDDIKGTLKIVAHRGLDQHYVDNLQIQPGERIAGKVFESNIPAILNRDNLSETAYSSLMVRPELSAAISFPLTLKNKVVGVINVSETENDCRFSDSDLEMLSIISDQAMMALGNIRSLKAREEQSRIRTLLEQYVSPEVSKMLVESRQDLMDVGSIQDLTVLFADIRNFTLLVQQVSPRQLREFLNIFFELLTSVVFSYKGMLDKFMGDAALAVFGAPIPHDNQTVSAVNVARELVAKFKELQDYWADAHPVFKQISLGVGVSRGPLFLGNVGSSKRVDYTVIGTEVNIAQRLASEMDQGQILLTKEAWDELGGKFDAKLLGPKLLRGMTSEIDVYKLLEP